MNRTGILLVLAVAQITSSSLSQAGQSEKKKREVEASFKVATDSFTTAITGNDVSTVVSLIDPRGVVLGHDRPATPRDQLLMELRSRSGFYRELFDGAGIDREWQRRYGHPPPTHIPSYKELLTKPGQVSIEREVVDSNQDGHWMGTLTLKRRKPTDGLPTFYYFDFIQQSGHWYLRVIWAE